MSGSQFQVRMNAVYYVCVCVRRNISHIKIHNQMVGDMKETGMGEIIYMCFKQREKKPQ